MPEEYKYHVDEQSLTQGFLLKWIWNPIVRILPARLKPNTITVIGVISMIIGTFFFWLAIHHEMRWGFLLAAFSVFIYMACDNVDGPHARNTKQSSRLGEFLDHWFDSINALLINLCVVSCLFLDGWLLMVCLSLVAISFFATIWEHHHTGVFHSGKIGTNEGLMLVIGLYCAMVFVFKTPFFQYSGPETINFASGMAYFSILVCLITTIKILLRVRSHFLEFIPIVIAVTTAAYLGYQKALPSWLAAAWILASNIPFCARFLLERLSPARLPYRGIAISILSFLGLGIFFIKDYLPCVSMLYFSHFLCFLLAIIMFMDLSKAMFYLGKKS
ncbi:MAG: CDP-alcohol phosphatidyltransferase family protein [Candidatus Brocadiae bacterium]|nr:CDP-alcohol phosphatidyltransferase family protein [Candidatus Brocadiia bacterium]